MTPRPRRPAAAVLGVLCSLLTTVACASAPSAPSDPSASSDSVASASSSSVRLKIPKLGGPYAVGRDTRHLVDRERRDLWEPGAARQSMVSMYYPAKAGSHEDPAPYMSRVEAGLLLKGLKLSGSFSARQVAATRTHARPGAAPVGGKHPLVVLSPGFTLPRTTLTLLSEDLASRGYVVALLDHAHEAFGATFPKGRVLTCTACEKVEEAPSDEEEKKLLAKAAVGRAGDISFLLDKLTGPRGHGSAPFWKHSEMIDARRVGAAGHSLGGNAAGYAMGRDQRIRAGVNLDGSFFAPLPRSGLGRPFLLLGTKSGHMPDSADRTWPRDWRRLTGWKRWLTVEGAGHFSFIDLPVLGGQLGETDPSAPLSGERCGEITTAYVGAFFDQKLRGVHQPLLDGPSARNPEVAFQSR